MAGNDTYEHALDRAWADEMMRAPPVPWRRREVRIGPARATVTARTDQPSELLDRELRLLFRAVARPPEGTWLEVPSWDASLAAAATAAGWEADGALTPVNLGAAMSCEAGLSSSPGWRIVLPSVAAETRAACAVLRAPYWLGRAGVEWCLRVAAGGLAHGGTLYLLGPRDRGIEAVRPIAERVVGPLTWRSVGEHRRLYTYERAATDTPPQEFGWTSSENLAGHSLTIHHHPLVYSPGRADPATRLLAANLPVRGGRWLDLGCGSGILAAVAAQAPDRAVTAIDWSYAAVETTAATLAANDLPGDVVLADGIPPDLEPFDVIVCYPPFHVGLRVSHLPGERLLDSARAALAPDGELVVVLTAAQSPARLLRPRFTSFEPLAESGGARVFRCRPG